MLLVLIINAVSLPALAAEVGNPIAHPQSARVSLDARYGLATVLEIDQQCADGDCEARLQRSALGLEAAVAVFQGVGIYGLYDWTSDTISEARMDMAAQRVGGGVRLALPLSSEFWLATDVRLSLGQSQASKPSKSGDSAAAQEQLGTGTVMGVWGGPDGGGHFWIGVQAPWLYQRDLHPMGDSKGSLTLSMKPKYPMNGVIGAILISDRIGSPWGWSPRLRTSIEMSLGYDNALTVSTGFGF